MRKLAQFRRLTSFIAGALIGASVWVPVFFATAADSNEGGALGLGGALALLVAGFALDGFVSRQRAPSSCPPGANRQVAPAVRAGGVHAPAKMVTQMEG